MNNILLSLSLGINLILTATLVNTLSNVPFDMDKVRNDYLTDVKFFFQKACIYGTDYPQEFKTEGAGFNQNSPMMYCSKEMDENLSLMLTHLYKVGRKTN